MTHSHATQLLPAIAIFLALSLHAGGRASGQCPGDVNGDERVTIAELVQAVNAALRGCPGVPTPTPPPACEDRFCDNGDGTITDNHTGLMWEKKPAADGIPGALHDVDNRYPWGGVCSQPSAPLVACQPEDAAASCESYADGNADACEVCPSGITCVRPTNRTGVTTVWNWVDELNSGDGFAAYTDWRLPTLPEIASIRDPALYRSGGAFNQSGCAQGCTDILNAACSCNKGALDPYWTATIFENTEAWEIFPLSPGVDASTAHVALFIDNHVRAVRSR